VSLHQLKAHLSSRSAHALRSLDAKIAPFVCGPGVARKNDMTEPERDATPTVEPHIEVRNLSKAFCQLTFAADVPAEAQG
jgi:hypothetical protein